MFGALCCTGVVAKVAVLTLGVLLFCYVITRSPRISAERYREGLYNKVCVEVHYLVRGFEITKSNIF